jgi:hypothetical protein
VANRLVVASIVLSPCIALSALALAASCGGSTLVEGNDAGGLEADKAEAGGEFQPAPGVDTGAPETTVASEWDGGPCYVYAGEFDQSCSVDSDCVGTLAGLGGLAVSSGNYCRLGCPFCGGEAINKSAAAQFIAAIANTPVVVEPPLHGCFCTAVSTAGCCQSGRCGTECSATPMDGGGD